MISSPLCPICISSALPLTWSPRLMCALQTRRCDLEAPKGAGKNKGKAIESMLELDCCLVCISLAPAASPHCRLYHCICPYSFCPLSVYISSSHPRHSIFTRDVIRTTLARSQSRRPSPPRALRTLVDTTLCTGPALTQAMRHLFARDPGLKPVVSVDAPHRPLPCTRVPPAARCDCSLVHTARMILLHLCACLCAGAWF
ncbi:hypothetical protein B0H17DRAFT_1109280 [Mycena rosella]|uniref:Uncharacterized protein n=1 Tax=Mycena rosella TaxID=1033263 RepID=A0AAD7FN56_MYCRO|nr:hypothetical protein B0H17DRAFT_1109280 [Mycena rosella]